MRAIFDGAAFGLLIFTAAADLGLAAGCGIATTFDLAAARLLVAAPLDFGATARAIVFARVGVILSGLPATGVAAALAFFAEDLTTGDGLAGRASAVVPAMAHNASASITRYTKRMVASERAECGGVPSKTATGTSDQGDPRSIPSPVAANTEGKHWALIGPYQEPRVYSIAYALETMPTGLLSAALDSITRPKLVVRPIRTMRASASTSKLTGRRKWMV